MKISTPYEIHVIDVPGVKDPATGLPLQHVLLYQAVLIDKDDDFPAGLMPQAARLLMEAGERWSQGHPGITSFKPDKRYALRPQAAAQRSALITRIRTFFGEVSDDEHIELNLVHGNERSSHRGAIWFLADAVIKLYDSALAPGTVSGQESSRSRS